MKRLTYEEVKEIFESKGNKLISTTYQSNKVPLKYICDCGKEDKKTINNFRNGQRCKECGKKKLSENLKFDEKQINKILGKTNCKLIGEYINAQIPFSFQCFCGEEDQTRLSDFKLSGCCKKCSEERKFEKIRQKYEKIAKEMFEKEGYVYVGVYKQADQPIEVKCPEGHEVKITTGNFKQGHRCGECSPTKKKTYEEVFDFFKNEGYQLISNEYQEAFSKLQAICPKNHDVETTWDSFRAGKRCARCNESKGEKRVEKYLLEQNFFHDRQFTFDDCKYKKKLPFDFVVFNPDQTINCLIEYDGHFHYIATDMTGGEKGLKETQKRDKIKTDYCRKNNIQLIRIKYTEFDRIEEILDKEIKIKTLA